MGASGRRALVAVHLTTKTRRRKRSGVRGQGSGVRGQGSESEVRVRGQRVSLSPDLWPLIPPVRQIRLPHPPGRSRQPTRRPRGHRHAHGLARPPTGKRPHPPRPPAGLTAYHPHL